MLPARRAFPRLSFSQHLAPGTVLFVATQPVLAAKSHAILICFIPLTLDL